MEIMQKNVLQNYKPTIIYIMSYMEEQIFHAPPTSKLWDLNQLFNSFLKVQ